MVTPPDIVRFFLLEYPPDRPSMIWGVSDLVNIPRNEVTILPGSAFSEREDRLDCAIERAAVQGINNVFPGIVHGHNDVAQFA
jgi:hypothetical protein